MIDIDVSSILSGARDPAWQLLFTLLASIVAIWIYNLQKGRRELAFGIISIRSLLSISEELSGQIKVTLDEKPVQDLRLIVVGLKNSGADTIRPSDFERPVIISFGESVEILSWQVAKEQPSNLRANVMLKNNQLEVMPCLLNRGDYITLQALASTANPKVSADIRIVGIDCPVVLNMSPRPPLSLKQGLANITFNVLLPLSVLFLASIGLGFPPKIAIHLFLSLTVIAYLAAVVTVYIENYFVKPSRRIDET